MEIDEKIKTIAPEIKALVLQSQKILITCHPRPDFDSVGSVLALGGVLRGLGKEVTMVSGNNSLPKFAPFFPGADKILNQNLLQTDLTQFDLFISTDMSVRARLSELGTVTFPPNLKVVVIDHHNNSDLFGQVNLVIPTAASAGEILFQLFSCWGIVLSPEIALCLLLSLYGDTGSFRYPNVSSRTFNIAAELIKLAPNYSSVVDQIENNEEFGRLRFRALGITKAERFFAGKLIITTITADDMKRCGITGEEANNTGLANLLRSTVGCVVAVSLVEETSGQIKLSSRGRNVELCDVSKLAGHFGGGGHQMAAGASIKGKSLEQVKTEIQDWFQHNC